MTELIHGDCLEVLRAMPDCSVDAVVTDPPYGLSFMGKKWDYDVPGVEVWAECLRVLKPGGHLLAFAGTRTQHRMAVRIEDAGFEIRDMIAWVYGSGFPKSLDVSKAIDKAAGAEREVVGETRKGAQSESTGRYGAWGDGITPTAPATDAAKQWQGWGTALKPALEPITVARKPLIGTVAENVLQHGTGPLNIDGCRVSLLDGEENPSIARYSSTQQQGNNGWVHVNRGARFDELASYSASLGRWPANFIHDGSEEVVGLFPQSNGGAFPKKSNIPTGKHYDGGWGAVDNKERIEMGSGSAARFFYCAKASKADRGENNYHITVKPTDLMRYLCRLVTPPNGVVLDPFMGSGSTGKAAALEGFNFIGIEREAEYVAIAQARINHVSND